MKVIILIKANEDSEAGKMPSDQLLSEMATFNEELLKAGIMLAAEGLSPSKAGKRVRFEGKRRTVIDGPFSETKELLAGFWIWQVNSMEEAVEWVKRIPNPDDTPTDVEIRPIPSLEDFVKELPPELRARETKVAEALQRQHEKQ